jgi:hypothetical protein
LKRLRTGASLRCVSAVERSRFKPVFQTRRRLLLKEGAAKYKDNLVWAKKTGFVVELPFF